MTNKNTSLCRACGVLVVDTHKRTHEEFHNLIFAIAATASEHRHSVAAAFSYYVEAKDKANDNGGN